MPPAARPDRRPRPGSDCRPGRPFAGSQSLLHYVRACRQFSKWLQREGRTAADALVGLKTYNPETDKRHERRGFTADEMAVLLANTPTAPIRWGMTGRARAAAYRLAFASGLRRNEIRTLTAASFDLDAAPPTVTVKAGYSKHRRQDVQPLPADVAATLTDFLATADPERPFPLPHKTARMLAEDMAEAREAWVGRGATEAEREERQGDPDFLMPRDSAGLVLDFHSFRHGYITAICKANVSPRVMMELARHSDPRLTMKRYSRVAVTDSAKALDALPKLTGPEAERAALRVTGTDGASTSQDAPGLRRTGDLPSAGPSDRPDSLASEGGRRGDASSRAAEKRFATRFAKSCESSSTSADSHEREAGNHDAQETLAERGEAAILERKSSHARVAQLDRASVYGTEGYRFESCRACST